MAPLVGEGRHALVVAGQVQQQERVRVVGVAVHVGARHLVLARQVIGPGRGGRFRQQVHVLLAERRHARQRQLARRRQAELDVELRKRRIDIVVVHVLEAEQLAAHLEIAVQLRQAPVGLLHQRSVDLRRHPAGVRQRAFHGARMVVRLGREDVRLHLGGQRRRQRGLVALEGLEESLEHQLAVFAVGRFALVGIGRLVQAHLAGGQRHLRPRQVGIHQLGADLLGAGQRGRGRGDHAFRLRPQGEGRLPQNVLQLEGELAKAWVGLLEGGDLVGAHGQDLGLNIGGGLGQLAAEGDGELSTLLRGSDRGVAVGDQSGIGVEPHRLPLSVRHGLQRGFERSRVGSELALVAGQRRQRLQHRIALGRPCLRGRIELGQDPGLRRRGRGWGLRESGRRCGAHGQCSSGGQQVAAVEVHEASPAR